MPRPGGVLLALQTRRCRTASCLCTRPAVASHFTATRSFSPPTKRCSSRSTRATGKVIWTRNVEDNSNGYYMTMAPLVADGKVMVGASGGEFGVRGFRRSVRRRDR